MAAAGARPRNIRLGREGGGHQCPGGGRVRRLCGIAACLHRSRTVCGSAVAEKVAQLSAAAVKP